MMVSKQLASKALRGALELRIKAGIANNLPLCIYDFAEKLGIEVMFCAGSSFEGMFIKRPSTILISSMRPSGRQAFTCAHEIGHWYFKHGTSVDEIYDQKPISIAENEQLANIFASYLLMPPWAIEKAFRDRNITPDTSTPMQLYAIACQLNVGYATLINQMLWSLKIISKKEAELKLKTTPKEIKNQICSGLPGNLKLVDRHWSHVPVDIEVGEYVILPGNVVIEGNAIETLSTKGKYQTVKGINIGISRAVAKDENWSTFIRVKKKNFTGRAIYRHMEDLDDLE